MAKSKAKPASEAKAGELQYVLMSGKHSRRNPDGETSTVYRPGDIVPDLSDEELAAFGDKFLTVAQFKAKAAGLEESQRAEVEREQAALQREAQERIKTYAPRDEAAEDRADKIAQMRAAQPKTEFNG